MAASKKQKLYSEMLDLALPHARNVQTWPWWHRLRCDLYPELELVHNIGPLLREMQFTMRDVYWINCQACNYNTPRAVRVAPAYPILALIGELIALVPPELRPALTWHGADDVPKPPDRRGRNRRHA